MGTGSRVLLVLLRLWQLFCGAIVLGILGRFFHLVDEAGVGGPDGKLVYMAVIAALTILDALVFLLPFAYSFWSFPIDIVLFVAWLVAFCLGETLSRINTCSSGWYARYWGFFWGRWFWVGPPGINVRGTGCAAWRTVLAFSFIALFLYLVSSFLGIYWVVEYGQARTRGRRLFRKRGAPAGAPVAGGAASNAPTGASSQPMSAV